MRSKVIILILFVLPLYVWLYACSSASTHTTDTPRPPLLLADEGSTSSIKPKTLQGAMAILSRSSSDYKARVAALSVIPSFGSDAGIAVDILIAQLAYDDTIVREKSAWALGEIGPAAKKAVPRLSEIVTKTTSTNERRSAVEALQKISDTSVVPLLASLLSDESVAIEAAKAIGHLADQPFPDVNNTGYRIENGIPIIVTAAKTWWEEKGQFLDWNEHHARTHPARNERCVLLIAGCVGKCSGRRPYARQRRRKQA